MTMSTTTMPFDLAELYRSVDRVRRESDMTWKEMSRQVGVAASTIRRFQEAPDAEADGVLALIGWVGVTPEHFVAETAIVGEPLPNVGGGVVRVDMTRIAESTGSRSLSTRTSIQRLVTIAQAAGHPISSFTRRSPY